MTLVPRSSLTSADRAALLVHGIVVAEDECGREVPYKNVYDTLARLRS